MLSAGHDKTIKLWDVAKGKEIKEFSGHSDAVTKAIISPDNAYIISGSRDTTVRVWNRKTGEYTCLVSGSKSKDWIIYTNDGYWDSSRNGGNLIAMVKGLECWNVDQFAVMNNRPDIILQRLCGSDTSLIHHYHSQYVKRLKRLGLTEETLKKEYTVPIAKIINTEQQGKLFTIRFELSDALYNLRSYNIPVNDVPLFGSLGNTISNTRGIPNGITKGKTEKITSKIELTTGENKIEVSCMNVNGAESFRTPVYASWDKHVKGDLYFIGFGVSHYKNKEFNLKYADKDVKDLADLFLRMKGTYFNNVYIKTYLNSEVTPESIKKSKKHLSKAVPDDTFVLFISGHGMHDDDAAATYYFLTYNTDLTNLAHTAADFEFIEDILQGIAPRNKLFLMDTCESGEIVETVQDQYYKESAGRGLRARTIRYEDSGDDKGILLINKRQKRPYLF